MSYDKFVRPLHEHHPNLTTIMIRAGELRVGQSLGMSLTLHSHMFQIMQGLSISLLKQEESNKDAGSNTQFILE